MDGSTQATQPATKDYRGNDESHEKPTGFDKIYPRLKSKRKGGLKCLYQRKNYEASSTVLRAKDGGGIPTGSFDMHMKWFEGKRRNGEMKPWWPDDDITMVELSRREKRNKNDPNPTKYYKLTEYGVRFVQYMLDLESVEKESAPHTLRSDLQDQSNRIDSLVNTDSEHDRRISDLEDEIARKDERINELEGHIETILNHLGV